MKPEKEMGKIGKNEKTENQTVVDPEGVRKWMRAEKDFDNWKYECLVVLSHEFQDAEEEVTGVKKTWNWRGEGPGRIGSQWGCRRWWEREGEGWGPGAKILEKNGVMSRKLVDEVRRMKRWYNGWNYWDKELKLKWVWGKQCTGLMCWFPTKRTKELKS